MKTNNNNRYININKLLVQGLFHNNLYNHNSQIKINLNNRPHNKPNSNNR